MSLLLDALQRASKEKEKLAEERAAADKAAQAVDPAPRAPLPPLTIDYGNSEPDSSPELAPAIARSPDSADLAKALRPSSESLKYPDLSFVSDELAVPLVSAVAPMAAPTELALDPIVALTPEMPATTELTPAQSTTDLPLASGAGASDIASGRKPEPVAEPVVARPEPTPQVQPQAGATDPAGKAAPAHPSPAMSSQVAREILGATAKNAKPGPNRRLVALGVVALLIAAANAAFFLGFLDKFIGVSSPGLTPSVPPAPVTVQSQPPSPPAATAEVQGGSDAPSSRNATADQDATAAPARAAKGSAVRSGPRPDDGAVPATQAEERMASTGAVDARPAARARGAKATAPIFTAKAAPVSALDSAYAALTEGRIDDAALGYRRALDKNPGERDALLGLAYIAQRQGDREEARAHYQQVLRQDPANASASAGMLTLAAEGDLQMTGSRAREMAERNPDSAVVLSTLGGILAKEGRISEAQQAYFRALTLEPDNALHAYNLAVALDRLHKYAPAQGYYQRALALAEKSGAGDRASFPRKEALQRLEQLRARDSDALSVERPGSGSEARLVPLTESRSR
jgi:tetratricopeptide (TPR) repeat protein